MTAIACDRCGREFDTDREPPVRHADTTRCPACGEQHDVDDAKPVTVVESAENGSQPAAPAMTPETSGRSRRPYRPVQATGTFTYTCTTTAAADEVRSPPVVRVD
jgi:uncharacterized Zn finger protein (UPF0148 family)